MLRSDICRVWGGEKEEGNQCPAEPRDTERGEIFINILVNLAGRGKVINSPARVNKK